MGWGMPGEGGGEFGPSSSKPGASRIWGNMYRTPRATEIDRPSHVGYETVS